MAEASDVPANVREILDLVRNGATGATGTQKPEATIDPTKNVLDKVEDAVKRIDDLRSNDKEWQEKLRASDLQWQARLDGQRDRADDEARKAEAGRIDALLLANTNNVALALEKQGAQASAQDKRIAVLEQNQYLRPEAQQAASRTQSNFNIGQAVTIAGIVVLVLVDLKTKGVI